ncbi:hypothetical protein ACHAPU_010821 [Fusarium lateritium]
MAESLSTLGTLPSELTSFEEQYPRANELVKDKFIQTINQYIDVLNNHRRIDINNSRHGQARLGMLSMTTEDIAVGDRD